MLGVKKWAIRFIAAVVLVSAFLPFTQLLTSNAQAVDESFSWNKTPAGYPEIVMRGGDFFQGGDGWTVSRDSSTLVFRPVPNSQTLNPSKPQLETEMIEVTNTVSLNDIGCRIKLIITLPKAGDGVRLDKGVLSVSENRDTCNRERSIMGNFYTEVFGSNNGGNSKANITISNASAISPKHGQLYTECQRRAQSSTSQGFEDCMNEGAAKIKTENTTGDQKATCVGGALGWFLCPFSEAAAGTMEALGGLIQGLLKVQPLDVTTPGTGREGGENDTSAAIYIIWNAMRNIANILFIIFFLVIIFSYVTSIGISNYGIKRTLPRLIVAAILVNVSYFICAIMIDIFNIIGASIEGIFQNGINAAVSANETTRPGATGGQRFVVGTIAAGILTTVLLTAGPSVLLLLLAPLISGVIAVLMLGGILIARQFLITLLVIFSPLIAVAWLLPGTEKFFKKGVNAGVGALASYPAVMAVVMGAELLVAFMTVTGVAPGVPGGGPNEALTAIGVLLMQILVVVLVITVLKNGTRIMSFISGRAGMLGKGGGGLLSKAPTWAKGKAADVRGRSRQSFRRKEKQAYRAARAEGRHNERRRRALEGQGYLLRGRGSIPGAQSRAQTRAERLAAWQNQSKERQRAETQHIADRLEKSPDYRRDFAGSSDAGRMGAALATGMQQSQSLEADEIKARKLVMESAPGYNPGEAAATKVGLDMIAALQSAREQGDSSAVRTVLQRASNPEIANDDIRKKVVTELQSHHADYRSMVPGSADSTLRNNILAGSTVSEDSILESTKSVLKTGKLSASAMASMDDKGQQHLRRAIDSLHSESQADAGNIARMQQELSSAQSSGADEATISGLQQAIQQSQERYDANQSVVTTTVQQAQELLNTPQSKTALKKETRDRLTSLVNDYAAQQPSGNSGSGNSGYTGGQTPGGGPSGYL